MVQQQLLLLLCLCLDERPAAAVLNLDPRLCKPLHYAAAARFSMHTDSSQAPDQASKACTTTNFHLTAQGAHPAMPRGCSAI